MRKQFVETSSKILTIDTRFVVLLGDIGVFGFRHAMTSFPDRVYNIGILEPTTVSLAAGLAREGFIPVVHTIAPFLIERAFEQIKIDFGYQKLGGNFVSVGASYDYAALGCTHHCPGDVGLLLNIPSVEICVPGTAAEFNHLFTQAYSNGRATYFRLSEKSNVRSNFSDFGKAVVMRRGSKGVVIAIGPMLDIVMEAMKDFDVSVLYYSTIRPFDSETLQSVLAGVSSPMVFTVEPFYQGTLSSLLLTALRGKPIMVDGIGVPAEFLTEYGGAAFHDNALGFSAENVRKKAEAFFL